VAAVSAPAVEEAPTAQDATLPQPPPADAEESAGDPDSVAASSGAGEEPTAPASVGEAAKVLEAADADVPEPASESSGAAVAAGDDCPSCGAQVPPNFKFCGACGHPMDTAQPSAAPAAPAVASSSAVGASLVLIRPDGTEGETVSVGDGSTVGRDSGGIFSGDAYLSPGHARFEFDNGGLYVEDADSLNGVFLRLATDQPAELAPGAVFRIGQELLRFDVFEDTPMNGASNGAAQVMGSPNPGYAGRLSLIIGQDAIGPCYPIPANGLHLGRERGDLLFPEDGYVSGLHARVLPTADGGISLTDVGSSNGTFVKVSGRCSVSRGDFLLLGQQLFRAEY